MVRVLQPLVGLSYFFNPARFFSTMNASSIVLPTREIEELWFGGLDLRAGQSPSPDTLKRWFRPDPTFDSHCK